MKTITDKARIEEIFSRGIVETVLPSKEALIEKLSSGDRLKIYIGADPTSSSLHLSHAKNYMFLEELRQLGHEVFILVGDFTARIGDPTGEHSTRKQLTEEDIQKNVNGWLSQIKPLLNFSDTENPPKVVYNNDWLSKLSFTDVVNLASNFTVQHMLERDMFEKRLNANNPIYLHEFLYPLMQGYDSVALDVDIELCGSDQTFNALAGRTLVKRLLGKEKFVVTVNLMANPKTGELMSKSKGTGVFLQSPAPEMYGAIMAQPDEMIEVLYINCTRLPKSELEDIMKQGPRDAKAFIAKKITALFYGDEAAEVAQENFINTFKKKEIPDTMPTYTCSNDETLAECLVRHSVVPSKSEWHRLVKEGAVSDLTLGQRIEDPKCVVTDTMTIKIGKKTFVKILGNK